MALIEFNLIFSYDGVLERPDISTPANMKFIRKVTLNVLFSRRVWKYSAAGFSPAETHVLKARGVIYNVIVFPLHINYVHSINSLHFSNYLHLLCIEASNLFDSSFSMYPHTFIIPSTPVPSIIRQTCYNHRGYSRRNRGGEPR
jgi:hypothetical protein